MPKIKLPENIKKLKSQLETGHNLVDYFLVAGINPIHCENDIIYDIKNKNYIENFKETIKPSIVCRFPSFDNAIDTIDEEIVNFCFPEGFEPILRNAKSIEKKFFSVILDNNLFSAEHPQKYLTCLLFYEKVSDYKKLKYSIEGKSYDKDPDCIDDENEIRNNEENNDMKNTILLENTLTSSSILSNNDNISKNNENLASLGRTNTMPIVEVNSIKNVFIPKCICLVSIYPYIKLYQRFLDIIYSYVSESRELPLEKIITNLIIEVPVPPKGLYSIVYNLI